MTAVTFCLVIAAIAAPFLLPGTVAAHSELQSGTPANGATVGTGPIDIVATFSEELAAKSHMELLDASGAIVANAAVDGNQMRIGLEGVQPGQYQVRWTSVADDGDVLRSKPGDWTFTVAATSASPPGSAPPSSAPPSSAPPSTPPTPASTRSPAPSAAPTSPASSSATDVLLPIVAAFVVIALLGTWLLRRRSVVRR